MRKCNSLQKKVTTVQSQHSFLFPTFEVQGDQIKMLLFPKNCHISKKCKPQHFLISIPSFQGCAKL